LEWALGGGIPLKDWTAWYKKELSALKPGVYEVIVHLAFDDDEMGAMVSHGEDLGPGWRQADVDMLKRRI
jgi:ABC-type proline/glycine betaine transport system substrate-binding protein